MSLLRFALSICAVLAAVIACSQSLITQAKIASVDEDGIYLLVGTDPLKVHDNSATRFWKDRKPSDRKKFSPKESVWVRANVKVDPPDLREMADQISKAWLDNIRKDFLRGEIKSVDAKFVSVKFDDGTEFSYRATDKSKIALKERPEATRNDLAVGLKAYFKGRLLPTLDTFLVEVTDVVPDKTHLKDPKGKVPKAVQLKDTDTIEVEILKRVDQLKMFEATYGGRTIAFTFRPDTKVFVSSKPGGWSDITPGAKAKVSYKRDKTGRLICTRIDITSSL